MERSGSTADTSAPVPARQASPSMPVVLSATVLALLAVALVAGGVIANVWRPFAEGIGATPPPSRWFDPGLLERVAAYRRPLRAVGVVASLVAGIGPLLVVGWWLHRGGGVRRPVAGRLERLRLLRAAPLRAALVAAGVLALQDALLLPFRFWAGFVHAGAYGLRTQHLAGWVVDLVLAMLPRWIAVAVVVGLVVAAVQQLRRIWPLVVGIGLALLSGLVVVVWPFVLEPLRYDFTPLGPGPPRAAVEAVLQEAGLDRTPILVADASRRTTARNAYVSGMAGTRRIVLYDTLLDLPDDEVAAVVAHEVAHALHRDVVRGWAAGAAAIVLASVGAGVVAGAWKRDRDAAVAARLRRPHVVALVVAAGLFVETATVPAVSWYSRRVEAAADATALRLTGDGAAFVELQRSLVEANLTDPSPPTWERWWRATHPPPVERLLRAEMQS